MRIRSRFSNVPNEKIAAKRDETRGDSYGSTSTDETGSLPLDGTETDNLYSRDDEQISRADEILIRSELSRNNVVPRRR